MVGDVFIITKKKENASKAAKTNVQKMVVLAVLIAILILMAFTPIGYLKTPGLEITFNLIPVSIGAVVLGPSVGAILGAVFGITSYLQCLGIPSMSVFGAALNVINPLLTFITCMVPRIICGFVPGLLFKMLSRNERTKFISHSVACLACPLLNTIFFMTAVMVFFGSSEYILNLQGNTNVFLFVVAFIGINGLVEAIACFIIATAVSKALTVLYEKVNKEVA